MEPIKTSLIIDAPRSAVWVALSDLEATRHWNPNVDHVECLTEKRTGLGARRRCFMHPSGWMTETVSEWEEGRVIAFTVHDAPPLKFGVGRFRLIDHGDGTLLESAFTYEVKLGPLGPVIDRLLVQNQLKSAWESSLRGLRNYVETRATAVA